MWRLLLPLALAAAQGAQYGDYGAAKMPAYGDYEVPREAASDDYRRPAAASLDYKYEAENKDNPGNTLNKEYRSGDSWQKSSRKPKRLRTGEDYADAPGHTRDPDRKYRAGHESPRVGHKRHSADEDEFSIEKYIQGINENNLEADVTYAGRRTTDRIIRRKPRDRDNADLGSAAAAYKGPGFDEEAPLMPMGRAPPPGPKDDGQFMDFREDVPSGDEAEEGPRPNRLAMLPVEKRVHTDTEIGPRRRPGGGRSYGPEGEEPGPPRLRPAQRARLDPGASDYDNDYYDVKRLRGMRRKPEGQRTDASDENVNLANEIPFAEMDQLERTGGRRAFRPSSGRLGPPRRPTTKRAATKRRTTRRTTRRSTHSTTEWVTQSTTWTIAPSTTPPTTNMISSTTTVSPTIVTTHAAPTLTPIANETIELSMAEKSRLSIMKKANRKERIGAPSTTKPPVLIQVTKMMPTVVLVASSTTGDPWMRAREVSGDSPETLAKVRQLMRAKLVANAKDIRDLTEDWDQEVCDYVDVKLLEDSHASCTAAPLVPLILLCALAKPL